MYISHHETETYIMRPRVVRVMERKANASAHNAPRQQPQVRAVDPWCDEVYAIALSSDRAAFQRVFEYFAPRLKAMLMKQGEAAEGAEELAQESLLTLWRRAGQFDGQKASVSTWLFTIARNKRIDRFRGRQRFQPDIDDPTFEYREDEQPDDKLSAAQDAASLKVALANLPPEMREALQMSFFDDMTHTNISEALGIPLGTVKSRIRRGLAALRENYEENRET